MDLQIVSKTKYFQNKAGNWTNTQISDAQGFETQ